MGRRHVSIETKGDVLEMARRFLRYTSFQPGELEARMKELTPAGQPPLALTVVRGGKVLLKDHTCNVRYLDGRAGQCRYERLGPSWHVFHYVYEELSIGRIYHGHPLINTPESIEAKAQELTETAYREAIDYERRNYFQRASEPKDGSRKRQPHLYRMKAADAKNLAGRYALCRRSGTMLFVLGPAYESLEAVNNIWRELKDKTVVVGCCNRLDRCFQLPRFNTLYAEFDPRLGPTMETDGGTSKKKGRKTPVNRCEGSDPETGAQCPQEAEPGCNICSACASRIHEERGSFQSWMREVTASLHTLCGMTPDDLPDCPYSDWHGAGLEPDEAAAEVLEWAR